MAEFSRSELCELRKRLMETCEGEVPLPPPEQWLDHELELVRETLYFVMTFRCVGDRAVVAKCIGVLACLRCMWAELFESCTNKNRMWSGYSFVPKDPETDVDSWLQQVPAVQLQERVRYLRLCLGILPHYFGRRLGTEWQLAFAQAGLEARKVLERIEENPALKELRAETLQLLD